MVFLLSNGLRPYSTTYHFKWMLFFYAECQDEKDGLAPEKYFQMALEIDLICSYEPRLLIYTKHHEQISSNNT